MLGMNAGGIGRRGFLRATSATAALFLLGRRASAEEGGDTVAKIKAAGKLRAGVAASAPYAFKDFKTGELIGTVIEVGKAAAKKIGVPLAVSEVGWDTIIAGLQADQYDVALAALFETPARQKVVDFVTIGQEGIAFLVRADNSKINSVDDLKASGVTIATVTGSGSEQMVKQNFASATIKSLISPTGGSGAPPEEVISGRVDAAQFDATLTLAYLKRFPGLKAVPADAFTNPLFPTAVGIAVHKGDAQLVAFLAGVVKEMQDSGELLQMRQKWSNPDILLGS